MYVWPAFSNIQATLNRPSNVYIRLDMKVLGSMIYSLPIHTYKMIEKSTITIKPAVVCVQQ